MQHIVENEVRFIEELKSWLAIPSVSASPDFADQLHEAATYLADRLRSAGAERVEILPTAGNPVVYARKTATNQEGAPTILVYGHYDVQPPEPYELWTTPPFEPTVRDGRLYARGACDDKGQVYMHVKALELLHTLGDVPCNIVFLIEGEEEIGSHSLPDFLRANRGLLACDAIVISDTALISKDCVSITVGLRGLAYLEVQVTSANTDMHSGEYGGAVVNPIEVLCGLLRRCKDDQGVVQVPNFYDKVRPLSQEERSALATIPFDERGYLDSIGAYELFGEAGYTTYVRVGTRPTFEINGIFGGYTGAGPKTVLPSTASAKVSMRLVPDQDPKEIADLFEAYFRSIAPSTVRVEVTHHSHGRSALTSTDSPLYRAAAGAMEQVWQQTPVPFRAGGSIPIVSDLQEILAAPVALMGFGLPQDALHAPDESFDLTCFTKGIDTIANFYHEYRQCVQAD